MNLERIKHIGPLERVGGAGPGNVSKIEPCSASGTAEGGVMSDHDLIVATLDGLQREDEREAQHEAWCDEEEARLAPLNARAWKRWASKPLWYREAITLRFLENFFARERSA